MTDGRQSNVEPLIHLKGVCKRYRMGTTIVAALQHVDFTSPAGGVIAVIGPSGSGKSTLLHVIGGMDRADEGEVMVAGFALEKLTPAQKSSVWLFYRENKSCDEIGQVLGMPAVTVKSHLHRARGKLRESLGGEFARDGLAAEFQSDSSYA